MTSGKPGYSSFCIAMVYLCSHRECPYWIGKLGPAHSNIDMRACIYLLIYLTITCIWIFTSSKGFALCFNLVLPSLEPPAHTFRALESCWHAGEGLPCCPVTSCGSSGAAKGRADEEYQVRAWYQVRANPLL